MTHTSKSILVFFLFHLSLFSLSAQVAINENNNEPDTSAMLDISSTDKGILIPRMSSTDRENISSPANGLMVFDSTTNSFWYYSENWQEISGAFISQNGITYAKNKADDFILGVDSINYGLNIGSEEKLFFSYDKAAFRVGQIGNNNWDIDSLGISSFAGGSNTKATGSLSFAYGSNTEASGLISTAMGYRTIASGNESVALGRESTASGLGAVALGWQNTASGNYTYVSGFKTRALGNNATAMGSRTTASGKYAFAAGDFSNASGDYSSSFGNYNYAPSYGEVAMGVFNVINIPFNTDDYDARDRLLVVGNGRSNVNRSNALVLYKSGNLELNGALTINNTYTFPTTDGTENQILTTNGHGTLAWSANNGAFNSKNGITSAVNNNDDFVFGADSLNRVANKDVKFFFDKSSGAFRAGSINTDDWNQDSLGLASVAMGENTKATGLNAVALGFETYATGRNATAIGEQTLAVGQSSMALGFNTQTSGDYSFAFGNGSIASAESAVAFGDAVIASEVVATAFGANTKASGAISTAFGDGTEASGYASITAGDDTKASGNSATAFGFKTLATGDFSTTFGNNAKATANSAVALGFQAEATDFAAIAFGHTTKASLQAATAFGKETEASNISATSFGDNTKATGYISTAFGSESMASGDRATAFGFRTEATGFTSAALGMESAAIGDISLAIGRGTKAISYGEVVLGTYNTEYQAADTTNFNNADRLFVIGNGTSTSNRSDALRIYKNGNMELNGNVGIGTAPVARLSVLLGGDGVENLGANNTSVTSIFDDPGTLWQSYTATADGVLTKVSLEYLDGSSDRTVSIYSGEGTTGTLLGSVTADVTGSGYYEFTFDFSGLNIQQHQGSVYTISIDNKDRLTFSLNNPYSGGIILNNPSRDLFFKVFYEGPIEMTVGNEGVTINDYTFPNSDGSTNQVLSTDGNGNLNWVEETGDNLGNHLATQNVQLGDNWLSKDGDDEGIFITDNGRIGIGVDTADATLHVLGGGSDVLKVETTANNRYFTVAPGGGSIDMYNSFFNLNRFSPEDVILVRGGGNVGIGEFTTTAPAYKLTVNGEPAANGFTQFTNYSDRRLKHNIQNIDSALARITQLRPVSFQYNTKTGYDSTALATTFRGFIAQELQTVFPEMVGEIQIEEETYLDANLSSLPIYLVKAIQEQQAAIGDLSEEVSSLKQENEQLKKQLEEIEALKKQVAKINQLETMLQQLQTTINANTDITSNLPAKK
ncbi:MAG: tail fiber domain-containing protein [Bacteroidota bacterium]